MKQIANRSQSCAHGSPDYEEYEKGDVTAEEADWWVDDVFENGESYQETKGI